MSDMGQPELKVALRGGADVSVSGYNGSLSTSFLMVAMIIAEISKVLVIYSLHHLPRQSLEVTMN